MDMWVYLYIYVCVCVYVCEKYVESWINQTLNSDKRICMYKSMRT